MPRLNEKLVDRPQRSRGVWIVAAGVAGVLLAAAVVLLLPALFEALDLAGRRILLTIAQRVALGLAATLIVVGASGLIVAIVASAFRRGRVALRSGAAAICAVGVLAACEGGARAWESIFDAPLPIPTQPKRSSDVYDVVVVGSSTALGYPFSPDVSLGQIVAWRLEEREAPRAVRCQIKADLGLTIEAAVLRLARLQDPPDLLIVVCGTTEFTARLKPERRVDFAEEPAEPAWRALYRMSLQSHAFRALYRALRPHWETERWGEAPQPRVVDLPWFTPSEKADILDGFERDLTRILEYAKSQGCETLVVLPPANERDFEPNRSVLAAERSAAELKRAERTFREARDREASDATESLRLYSGLIKAFPEFAEAHFRIGRLLEAQGEYRLALGAYERAVDEDAMPTRFSGEFRELCARVAKRFPGTLVIDGRAALRAATPHGIIDDHVMLDGPHPSMRGTVVLANTVLDALGLKGRVTTAEVIAHFQLGASTWYRAARWGHDFYQIWARVRADNRERETKRARFEEWAERIEAGLPIDEVQFEPLAVTPSVSGDTGVNGQ